MHCLWEHRELQQLCLGWAALLELCLNPGKSEQSSSSFASHVTSKCQQVLYHQLPWKFVKTSSKDKKLRSMVSLVPQGSALLLSSRCVVYLGCHTFNCHLRVQHLNALSYHVSYLITLYVSSFSSVSHSLLPTQLISSLLTISIDSSVFCLILDLPCFYIFELKAVCLYLSLPVNTLSPIWGVQPAGIHGWCA